MSEKIKFNFEDWDVNISDRSRNRMKLRIKLNKQETEAFKAFYETVKPAEITQDQFLKQIFLYGCDAVNQQLVEAVKQYAEEHKEELEEQGITFDTSGEVAKFHTAEDIESDGSVVIFDDSEE